MNIITVENKGTITLGAKVMVSDPCYGLNTWCQGILENVLPGEYECVVGFVDEGKWGTRVAGIEVIHKDYTEKLNGFNPEEFEVGVDSGTAGIFDYEYYAKYHSDCKEKYHVDNRWYDAIFDKTEEYIVNPDYTPFTDTAEYKAGILAYKNDLDELATKYPKLDVMSVYLDLINEYNSLEKEKPSFDFDSLIQTLKDLNKILENKDCQNKVLDVVTTTLEKAEGETELFDIKCKYERNMHKLWLAYQRGLSAQKKIYRRTGNTVDNFGFVSSAGYGDGSYTCRTAKNSEGKIVAIQVEYIGEDDDEGDEE